MSPKEEPCEVICAISWWCHSIGMFSKNQLVNEFWKKEVKKTFNNAIYVTRLKYRLWRPSRSFPILQHVLLIKQNIRHHQIIHNIINDGVSIMMWGMLLCTRTVGVKYLWLEMEDYSPARCQTKHKARALWKWLKQPGVAQPESKPQFHLEFVSRLQYCCSIKAPTQLDTMWAVL